MNVELKPETNNLRKPMNAKVKTRKALSTQEQIAQFQHEIRSSQLYREVEAREDFVDRIYNLMEVQNLSRADLARKLKCTPAYVTRILSGDVNFTIETLVKICDAFEQKLVINCEPRSIETEAEPETKIVELSALQAAEKWALPEVALKERFRAAIASWQKPKVGVLTARTNDSWMKSGADNSKPNCGDETDSHLRRVA